MNFDNNSNCGLVVWGTKRGLKCFFTCNAEEVRIGEDPFRDANSLFTDLNPYRVGENAAYLISRLPGYTCITGYWSALDDLDRQGFLAISLLIPPGKYMEGDAAVRLIKKFTEIYWNTYILKSPTQKSIKSQVVEDKYLFYPLLAQPEFQTKVNSDKNSREGASNALLKYKNEPEVAYVIKNLAEDEYLPYQQLYLLPADDGIRLMVNIPEIPMPKIEKKFTLSVTFVSESEELDGFFITASVNNVIRDERTYVFGNRYSLEKIKMSDQVALTFAGKGYITFSLTPDDLISEIKKKYNDNLPDDVSVNIKVHRERSSFPQNTFRNDPPGQGNSYSNESGSRMSSPDFGNMPDKRRPEVIKMQFVDEKEGETPVKHVDVVVKSHGKVYETTGTNGEYSLIVDKVPEMSLEIRAHFYKTKMLSNQNIAELINKMGETVGNTNHFAGTGNEAVRTVKVKLTKNTRPWLFGAAGGVSLILIASVAAFVFPAFLRHHSFGKLVLKLDTIHRSFDTAIYHKRFRDASDRIADYQAAYNKLDDAFEQQLDTANKGIYHAWYSGMRYKLNETKRNWDDTLAQEKLDSIKNHADSVKAVRQRKPPAPVITNNPKVTKGKSTGNNQTISDNLLNTYLHEIDAAKSKADLERISKRIDAATRGKIREDQAQVLISEETTMQDKLSKK